MSSLEVWEAVIGWEGYYEVSDMGRVRSLLHKSNNKTGQIHVFKPYITKYGYLRVSLSKDNKKVYRLVHRLVAEAFLPNPTNLPFVDHKDNNKANPVSSNLQWCTTAENNQFAFDRGRAPVKSWLGKNGANHNKSKKVKCLTLDIVFGSAHEAARELGLGQGNISAVCRGEITHTLGFNFMYL